ncbi:hypothetical protein FA95DRAFT_1684676 [Auriscalpium vulgare]|uniref:Uncharacterized protein n=1 Tax=Auriscalpium vulgare TaxID=40419 RepID=A0ACB8R467_9AGAM|nr:hypothetical protein FA95DRAFT_1684676 [Auriscalpium vulgare]
MTTIVPAVCAFLFPDLSPEDPYLDPIVSNGLAVAVVNARDARIVATVNTVQTQPIFAIISDLARSLTGNSPGFLTNWRPTDAHFRALIIWYQVSSAHYPSLPDAHVAIMAYIPPTPSDAGNIHMNTLRLAYLLLRIPDLAIFDFGAIPTLLAVSYMFDVSGIYAFMIYDRNMADALHTVEADNMENHAMRNTFTDLGIAVSSWPDGDDMAHDLQTILYCLDIADFLEDSGLPPTSPDGMSDSD